MEQSEPIGPQAEAFGKRLVGRSCYLPRQVRLAARAVLGGLFAASLLALLGGSAEALVVSTTLDTTVNPADYGPAWTQGDPGWDNVTSSGNNYVYLGDSWVLSARHVGVWSATFTVDSQSNTFNPIPNQDFVVPNPTGSGLSSQTDLRLIRIDGDPGLPDLAIATAPPSANSEVMTITNGPTRLADPSYWNSSWGTATSEDYDYSGYKSGGPREKRWGTNRIAGPGTTLPTGYVLNNVRVDVQLLGGDDVTRDVVSIMTMFDENGTDFETHAVSTSPTIAGGDSGGGLFRKQGGQWKLAGIADVVFNYSGQPISWGVYGDATSYVDLSYYRNEIETIMSDNQKYSVLGDINLSGSVTGDGTGDPETDDISAFIAGWLYDNGTGEGDITSWTNGDMNLDGKTNLGDLLMMRDVLASGSGSGLAALTSLLGDTGTVPEPSSAVLLVISMTWFFAMARRRLRGRAL